MAQRTSFMQASGACLGNNAPAAVGPQRHLFAILSLTWYRPCARNDRKNLLVGGRPRDGDCYRDRLLSHTRAALILMCLIASPLVRANVTVEVHGVDDQLR